MPEISVVIRCLNEEAHIARLLSGLAQQTIGPAETIIVDSGSTDATLDIASRYPNVRILRISQADFSFGRSLNLGCSAATGTHIVIASAHVYPLRSDWIAQLTTPLLESDVAITYGAQRGDERTKFSEHQIFASWFPADGGGRQNHPFCNNANSAINRDLWRSMPFDEGLTGLEDLEWAHRAQEGGYAVYYCPDASVAHIHEESWSQIRNRYRREAIAYRSIYPTETMGLGRSIALAAVNSATDILKAIKGHRPINDLPDIVGFRTSQFAGTFQGYHHKGPVSAELRRRFYFPSRTYHEAPAGSQPDPAWLDYSQATVRREESS